MRTTITLDDALLAKASEATGVHVRTRLVYEGLHVLVVMAGTDPDAWIPERRHAA